MDWSSCCEFDGDCEGGVAEYLALQIVGCGEELGGGGAEEGVCVGGSLRRVRYLRQ